MFGVVSADLLSIYTPPTWRGFSFALHLLRMQGFYFALLQYSPIQAFTVRFMLSVQLYRPRCKTAHGALQALYLRFAQFNRPRHQTETSGYNTHLRHAGAYHSAGTPPVHTRYKRHAGRFAGQHSRPIIIMYIRGAAVRPLLWIHARRCSIQQTMQTRRGQRLHLHRVSPAACNPAPSTRRGSPAAGARRAARNH